MIHYRGFIIFPQVTQLGCSERLCPFDGTWRSAEPTMIEDRVIAWQQPSGVVQNVEIVVSEDAAKRRIDEMLDKS